MVVVLPPLTAEESTGKFCRLLGPASPSAGQPDGFGSFAVRPSAARSMPSPRFGKVPLLVLANMALPRTELLIAVLPSMIMPPPELLAAPLKAMRFPAPVAVPPIVLPEVWTRFRPCSPFPSGLTPSICVPIKLPCTTVPVTPRRLMPSRSLPDMTLRAPSSVPPIVILAAKAESLIDTPSPVLPKSAVPLTSVPMRLP